LGQGTFNVTGEGGAGSGSPQGQDAVESRVDAKGEFAAVFLQVAGWRCLFVVLENGEMFLDRLAKIGIDFCLVIAMDAAKEQGGALADKTSIFIGPIDDFLVITGTAFGRGSGGYFFDGLLDIAGEAGRRRSALIEVVS
jgi:hypothetical protein